ncbi:MAG: endonuclease/exonuclease/phosphatase family protein [Robiginitomaculum sp.]
MRLLSWNILQGGGRRADDVIKTIAGHNPDIVTLQEFRRGSAAGDIKAGLKAMGLKYIHIPETQKAMEHTILIASKFGFDAGPFLPEPNAPLALLEAYFAKQGGLGFDLSLIAVHFPQKRAQIPLFRALKDDSPSLLKTNALIIGDLNCGIPLIDSDSKSFSSTHYYQDLLHGGWIDSWRSRHKTAREFSWVSPRTGNRFRYDQCLSSEGFDSRISALRYDHEPREARYSDHSLMVLDFD